MKLLRRRIMRELGPFATSTAIAAISRNQIELVDGRTFTRPAAWHIHRPWRLTYDDGVIDHRIWTSISNAMTDVLWAELLDAMSEESHVDPE